MADNSSAPSRISRTEAPWRSSGSAARALWKAATALSLSPSCWRSSPRVNQAEANLGASAAACSSRSAAPVRSPFKCRSRANSKRRSAFGSPEEKNKRAAMGTGQTLVGIFGLTYMTKMRPQDLLMPTSAGLCCKAGGFHIDPVRAVERAVITHGHSDHARSGHGAVLATQETLDIMRLR